MGCNKQGFTDSQGRKLRKNDKKRPFHRENGRFSYKLEVTFVIGYE